MITVSKLSYFKDKMEENSTNPSALLTIIGKVLHRKTESTPPLSEHTSQKVLAENFSTYFQSKISKTRASLDSQKQSSNLLTFDVFETNCSFDSISRVSEVEIDKIIKQSPSKSCDLDPIPTSLLKENISSSLPLFTEIVNHSISSATFQNNSRCLMLLHCLKTHHWTKTFWQIIDQFQIYHLYQQYWNVL